jgi:hypothetical protein
MPMLTTPAGRFCFFNKAYSSGPIPTITQQSLGFNFPGNTYAEVFVGFSQTNATDYTWELNSSPTENGSYTQIASGSGRAMEDNTITYYGETTYEFWFNYKVTVTNSSGSAELYTQNIQNVYPT